MKKKSSKVTITDLSNRLENDESAWVKQLSSLGDFARYWRQLETKIKKDQRAIKRLQKRVLTLEYKIKPFERLGGTPDVAN